MTDIEIKKIRKQYKEFLLVKSKILELQTLINNANLEGQYGIPKNKVFQEILSDYEALKKIYFSFKIKPEFNIKIYMGSYAIYSGSYDDDFTYQHDLLVFDNAPDESYKNFWDIEGLYEYGKPQDEFIWKPNPASQDQNHYKHLLNYWENYQKNNILIYVPNNEIINSIKEASNYSLWERFINPTSLKGSDGNKIKFNHKIDVDHYGVFNSIQNEFLNLLLENEPNDAIKQLVKKYAPYKNFYDYKKNKKKN